MEESKGRYKSGKIEITTSSFPVACCRKCRLPGEAANSTVLGGLVIAPSCPAEIIEELYPVWVGFLFSSRTGRQLQGQYVQ